MKLADWSLLVILAQAQAKLACWETERFTIESACRTCDRKGDEQRLCAETGFIEKLISRSIA